eukprot:403337422
MGACCSAENRESLAQQFKRFQQQQQTDQSQYSNSSMDGGLAPVQQPKQKNQSLLFVASQNQPLSIEQQFELQQQMQMLTPQQQQQFILQQQMQVQQLQLIQQQQQSFQPIQKSSLNSSFMSQSQSSPQQNQYEKYEDQMKYQMENEVLKEEIRQQKQHMDELQQMVAIQDQVKMRLSNTPASANLSPDISKNNSMIQPKSFQILQQSAEGLVKQFEKIKKDGLYQQSIQSDNQLREEFKLFEGNYITVEEGDIKELKLFIKIDESTNTVVGFYHDKHLEYQLQGVIDPDSRQILIGLFKRPLLLIVGQYHQNLHKIQGFTMDQDCIDDSKEWHETTLLLKNA